MKRYKVVLFMDDTYEVLEFKWDDNLLEEAYSSVHQGSLSDCEAYIRLNEGGYM